MNIEVHTTKAQLQKVQASKDAATPFPPAARFSRRSLARNCSNSRARFRRRCFFARTGSEIALSSSISTSQSASQLVSK
jgi:hypothetical protein